MSKHPFPSNIHCLLTSPFPFRRCTACMEVNGRHGSARRCTACMTPMAKCTECMAKPPCLSHPLARIELPTHHRAPAQSAHTPFMDGVGVDHPGCVRAAHALPSPGPAVGQLAPHFCIRDIGICVCDPLPCGGRMSRGISHPIPCTVLI
jgi:hypothetical protein